MDFQVEIKEEMRSTLADRLIDEFHCYELIPETLYLTFYIVDQYLSREKVMETDLMLVGVGAMLIASKYEDSWPLGVPIIFLINLIQVLCLFTTYDDSVNVNICTMPMFRLKTALTSHMVHLARNKYWPRRKQF